MNKRWKLAPADNVLAAVMAEELKLLPLTAQLLINRGVVDADAAAAYLRPSLADIPDPFLMMDMDKAVERVRAALNGREKIAVWGDYDVDGATASALLYLFFKELGSEIVTYMPGRHTEGYGLNIGGLRRLKDAGVTLVITVDCGSSDHEAAAFASSIGLDLIITDHHEMAPKTNVAHTAPKTNVAHTAPKTNVAHTAQAPAAYAVLNPKQRQCGYPFKGLAGVGVAFCFVLALRSRLRATGWFRGVEPNLKRYLDLVCIGTVADIVPLVGVNRALVSWGLRELAASTRPGLKALIEVSRLRPGMISAEDIAFRLAPRINAVGRLSSADMALRLLTTRSAAQAASSAAALDAANSERQNIEGEILKEALLMHGAMEPSGKAVVLASEGWNAGVIGIVASRLVERLARPVVMIAIEAGVGRGSARGVKAFDLIAGLNACGHLLTRFGGHKAAAGLSVTQENIDLFRDEFVRYADAVISEGDLVPEVRLDASVTLADINERLVTEIASLAPFGSGNREPLLCLSGADIASTEVVGARHLRFNIRDRGGSRSGIGFGLAAFHPVCGNGYALACAPYMDEWQGTRTIKLRITDLRPQDAS